MFLTRHASSCLLHVMVVHGFLHFMVLVYMSWWFMFLTYHASLFSYMSMFVVSVCKHELMQRNFILSCISLYSGKKLRPRILWTRNCHQKFQRSKHRLLLLFLAFLSKQRQLLELVGPSADMPPPAPVPKPGDPGFCGCAGIHFHNLSQAMEPTDQSFEWAQGYPNFRSLPALQWKQREQVSFPEKIHGQQ